MRRRTLYFLLISMVAVAVSIAAEYPSQLGSHDLRWGSGTWVDNGGRTRYYINGLDIPFSYDNAIKLGNANLYNLSSSVVGNWKIPYTNGSGVFVQLALDNAGLCLKSGGVASAPIWGACVTGGTTALELGSYATSYIRFGHNEVGGAFTIERFYPGNFRIFPGDDDAKGIFMDNTGYTTFQNGILSQAPSKFNDTVLMASKQYFGVAATSSYYNCSYDTSTKQFICTTALTGSTMTSTNPAFQFTFSDAGAAVAGQRVFGVKVDNTLVFLVDEAGNIETTGSITGSQFISDTPDLYRAFNDLNSTGYEGAVEQGTTYYDGSLKIRRTYDGTGFRNQNVTVPIPANENAACTPGMTAADNTWLYVCYSTNKWKTILTDNVWKATTYTSGSPAPPAAISHVQTAGYNSAGGTSTTVALPFVSSNTSGNFIVVTAWGVEDYAITGVSDSANGAYTKGPARTDNTFVMYYRHNVASGANTVTVTWNGVVTYPRVSISEFSGIKTSAAYDVGAAGEYRVGVVATNGNYTNNVTATVAGDLVVAAFLNRDSGWGGIAATGTGLTGLYDSGGDYLVEWKAFAGTGAVNATMTPNNVEHYDWIIGTFKVP